jgi:ATP-dependent Clp protease ATP-binding subunit ClpX
MFKRRHLRCSFCGKSDREVAKLVAGPGVFICDGCVREATRLMRGSSGEGLRPDRPGQPPVSRWSRLTARLMRMTKGNIAASAALLGGGR